MLGAIVQTGTAIHVTILGGQAAGVTGFLTLTQEMLASELLCRRQICRTVGTMQPVDIMQHKTWQLHSSSHPYNSYLPMHHTASNTITGSTRGVVTGQQLQTGYGNNLGNSVDCEPMTYLKLTNKP